MSIYRQNAAAVAVLLLSFLATSCGGGKESSLSQQLEKTITAKNWSEAAQVVARVPEAEITKLQVAGKPVGLVALESCSLPFVKAVAARGGTFRVTGPIFGQPVLRHVAVICKSPEILLLALTHGLDANERLPSGQPAVTQFLGQEHAEIATMLLNYGADANAKLPDGTAWLEQAIASGNDELTALLLAKGAELKPFQEQPSKLERLFDLARKKESKPFREALLARLKADGMADAVALEGRNLFSYATHYRSEELAAGAIAIGSKLDQKDKLGVLPAMEALYWAIADETGMAAFRAASARCSFDPNGPVSKYDPRPILTMVLENAIPAEHSKTALPVLELLLSLGANTGKPNEAAPAAADHAKLVYELALSNPKAAKDQTRVKENYQRVTAVLGQPATQKPCEK